MKILHYLFNYKSTIFISLIVLIITILCLNIYPIKKEHSLIENALFTGSIISPVIFLFITIGLFKGLFCKNNNIDLLIDDSIKHCKDCQSYNIKSILFARNNKFELPVP